MINTFFFARRARESAAHALEYRARLAPTHRPRAQGNARIAAANARKRLVPQFHLRLQRQFPPWPLQKAGQLVLAKGHGLAQARAIRLAADIAAHRSQPVTLTRGRVQPHQQGQHGFPSAQVDAQFSEPPRHFLLFCHFPAQDRAEQHDLLQVALPRVLRLA